MLRSVQEGIETDDQLMTGFIKGISDAFNRAREPFTSESIAPEAIIDIVIRGGVTDTGTKLYTDATPVPDKMRIIMEHLLETQIPFSKSQLSRIYYAAKGLPDPKGNIFDLEKELPGLLGWRLIEINPVKGLGFKITQLDKDSRDAVREFTGGDTRLLSSPTDREEVLRQFFIANKALFEAQQGMHLDLKAANQFDVEDEQLAEVFVQRNISGKEYGPLFEGQFRPYIPSNSIIQKFYDKSQEFSAVNPMYTNPLEDAFPQLREMIEAFQGADLSKAFPFKLSDFGLEALDKKIQMPSGSFDPFSSLPMPSANVIQTSQLQAPGNMNQGLTPIENALLSEEEKAIKLRQRGLA
jgi:hypothetical protein